MAARAKDALVDLLLDPEVIEIASTLMARLERVRYDATRRGVFRTKWARDLFHSGASRLSPEVLSDFDVDEWFGRVVSENPPERGISYEFGPNKAGQDVDTNWLAPLLRVEMKVPGFIRLLHSCIDIEARTHDKMAAAAEKDDHYDFIGVGPRNRAQQQRLLASSTATQKSRPLLKGK